MGAPAGLPVSGDEEEDKVCTAICSDNVGDMMGIQRYPLEQKPFWITKDIPRKEQKNKGE